MGCRLVGPDEDSKLHQAAGPQHQHQEGQTLRAPHLQGKFPNQNVLIVQDSINAIMQDSTPVCDITEIPTSLSFIMLITSTNIIIIKKYTSIVPTPNPRGKLVMLDA